jgi:hypothetical protein
VSWLLAPVLAPLPIPKMRTLGLQAQLVAAEKALNHRFDKRASLKIDALVMRLEQAHRRVDHPRGWRRAA